MNLPLVLVVFLFLGCLATAEPTATWDGFIQSAPKNQQEADQMSLALNRMYLSELDKLDTPPIRWWVRRSRQHYQQNIENARSRLGKAASDLGPAANLGWKKQAQRFLSEFAAEEARLARLYPKHYSEVHLEPGEKDGWELPDGSFRLTFDDGPKPSSTHHIIKALGQAHYPATFFLLGKRVQEARTSGKMPNYKGFTLGNHTYDHCDLVTLSADLVQWQLRKTQQIVETDGTRLSQQFRAPYGSRGAREVKIAKGLGLQSVMWNVDSQDWQATMQSEPGRIASRTLALMLLTRRGIVLMHDIHAQTSEELDLLIPAFKAVGFRIVE